MKKNILYLFILFLLVDMMVMSCKKKHHEDPVPVTGGNTSGTTTPPVPTPPTTSIGIGTLTFQDTTISLAGTCVNTSYGFLMAATDSVNTVSVLFYPSKPTTSQTIDLSTVIISPRLGIYFGNELWLATSGNLKITVLQDHVSVQFSNVTFTNNTTGQTALGSGSIICL